MLQLYSAGGGSHSVQLIGPVLDNEQWGILLRSAKRLLKHTGEIEAVRTLEDISFDLLQATNDFGDEFEILYAVVPTRQYLSVEETQEFNSRMYSVIADAFSKLNHALRFIVLDIDTHETVKEVTQPTLRQTSETLEHALSDAETLLRSRGATSGLDRVHTAFHAYLRLVCTQASVGFRNDASTSALLGLLRQHHPNLIQQGSTSAAITDALRGLARVVEALTPARNLGSLAHPNEDLLDEPEAMLFINSIRTLLHYLDQKLR